MKRPLLAAMLYAALTLGANPLLANGIDAGVRTEILDMREDSMRKLNIPSKPAKVSGTAFETEDGRKLVFSDSNGKFRLVNFWATWCPPCREEMPSLDRLQADFGGEDFQVMTIATGRNRIEGIYDFFEMAGVTNLPILLDPRGKLAREMGALGLPTTLLLDRNGREIARLTGGADWSSDNAKAVLRALMEASDHAAN